MEFEREELCEDSALAVSVGEASSCVHEVERGDSGTSGDSGSAPGINECNKEHASRAADSDSKDTQASHVRIAAPGVTSTPPGDTKVLQDPKNEETCSSGGHVFSPMTCSLPLTGC
mmetsp:Transcript_52933/g.77545  ORF Transcript_52933/g.77545 Transcript_52933/m.77545 type:complete len:116 (-) Transcript_52933:414-761(-)